MRTTTETLDDAITNTEGILPLIYAVIQPSRIYFESITSDYPWSGADAKGVLDEPTLQEVAYSPADDLLVTFFNDAGTLKYTKQGSSSVTSLSLSIDGKPGVNSDRLYRISSGSVYRHVITWISGPTLGSATTINTPAETPLVAHGVSSTQCAILTDADGGLRPAVIDNTTLRSAPSRFMFPTAIDYGDTRTMLSLASFSGAAMLDDKVFIYVSNCQKGWVEGIFWDSSNNTWSDIFIVVPTELQTSLCEFRVSNVYETNGVIYIVGLFSRTDSIDNPDPCTLIAYSRDGKVFALDRFTLVTDLGYRFQAAVGNDRLYLGHCNRVCYSDVVYTFNGDDSGCLELEIPKVDIISFSDNSVNRAQLVIKAGDEYYQEHAYIRAGSRVKVYVGYVTEAVEEDEEYVLYGTYIIDEPDEMTGSGQRQFSLQMIHEGQWKMRGLNMPFYTEIIGKSSVYDSGEEVGNLHAAAQTYFGHTSFSIDFWKSQPYTDSYTGINLLELGGVAPYSASGAHDGVGGNKLAFRTDEIKSVLNLHTNPLITGTLTFLLYGWSRSDTASTVNDEVELLLITTNEDGEDEQELVSNEDKHWSNTYPEPEVPGHDPIEITIYSQEGRRIKYLGMVWSADHSTVSYASRIDVTAGVQVEYIYDDPNTPWELVENEGYLLPAGGRPYIMFSQKPYNAWNFQMSASFEISVTGGISGFPVMAGIVGLGENGSNYILGAYDKVTDTFKLVKCRDGISTTLASEAATVTVGDDLDILFQHKNGRFKIYVSDEGLWTEQLSYDWEAADEWMYTSDVVAPKCGIYGYISAPSFKIVGLSVMPEDLEDWGDYAPGVGTLPLETVYYFPDSGTIRIGDDLYTYSGRTQVSTILGPYQFRQNGLYSPPYGDGYGMEVTHFDWTAATNELLYQMFAIDAGHGYINSSTLWQVWVTTDGEVEWLRNRARYYSYHPNLANQKYSNSNRVYVTGGLRQVRPITASPVKHSWGEICSLELSGRILCHWMVGASGEEDTTVADLISRTCSLAGTTASLLGERPPYTVTAYELIQEDVLYPDGYDLHFNAPTVADLSIRCNIAIEGSDRLYSMVTITHLGDGDYTASIYACDADGGNPVLQEAKPYTSTTGTHLYRILYHDNSISLYADGKWVYTYIFEELTYPASLTIRLASDTTLSNTRFVELSDWREAVYIDLETDALSAMGSIIQERPVEIAMQADGTVGFWYWKYVTSAIDKAISPQQHRLRRPSSLDASSDAIVYGTIDVGVVRDLNIAREIGFSTKIHKFSNMNRGAILASKTIQMKAYQRLRMHEITTRSDVRIEVGDLVDASFTASGTGRTVTASFIVESVDLNYNDNSMRITGREYVLPS